MRADSVSVSVWRGGRIAEQRPESYRRVPGGKAVVGAGSVQARGEDRDMASPSGRRAGFSGKGIGCCKRAAQKVNRRSVSLTLLRERTAILRSRQSIGNC
jgi:hypothetical protein